MGANAHKHIQATDRLLSVQFYVRQLTRLSLTILRDTQRSPRLPPPHSVLQGRGKPAGVGVG